MFVLKCVAICSVVANIFIQINLYISSSVILDLTRSLLLLGRHCNFNLFISDSKASFDALTLDSLVEILCWINTTAIGTTIPQNQVPQAAIVSQLLSSEELYVILNPKQAL